MTAQAQNIGGDWKIVDGTHWIKSFGVKALEAQRSLQIIKHYQFTSICFVQRPGPRLEYFKQGASLPAGGMPGEDCVGFNPNTATVQPFGAQARVVDGNHAMMLFPNMAQAQKALAIIKMHQARFQCFVGRPGPSMTYLKK